MKSLYHSALYVLAIGMLVCNCTNSGNRKSVPWQVRDYVHDPKVQGLFYEADSLKYEQDYPGAAIAFAAILQSQSLSTDKRIYALNQLAFVKLAMRETDETKPLIDQVKRYRASFSEWQLADYLYNLGVYHLQKVEPQDAKNSLEAALHIYKSKAPKNPLRTALTLAQLALYQIDFGWKAEEVSSTIETAYQHFYPNNGKDTSLHRYAAELNYAMAQYYRIGSRDYLAGLNHCELTEKLIQRNHKWQDKVLLARCLGVKGLLLRKGHAYEKADSVMREGLAILKNHDANSIFMQEMYRFLLVNSARRAQAPQADQPRTDSLYHQYWKEVEEHLQGKTQQFIQMTQINAYYCYYRRPGKKTECLAALKKLVKTMKPDLPAYRYYIEEAYNFLATINREDTLFEAALDMQLKSFKTEIAPRLKRQIKSWDDALKPEFANLRINPFFSFARAGNIYLRKFQVEKDTDDLVMSLRLYEAADKAMSLSLNMGKDGVLSYQQEIGNEVYNGGLETLLEAWRIKDKLAKKLPEVQILDLAFRFFERQKSFILFREDLLKNDNAEASVRRIKKLSEEITKLRKNQGQDAELQALSKAYFDYQQALNKLYEQFIGRFDQDIQTAEEIRYRLKAKQVLVQYKACDNFTYVLAVSKKGFVFDTIGKTAIVKEDLAPFLNLLKEPHRTYMPELVDRSKVMYTKLIKPFKDITPPAPAELIIIPDRFLTDLPFEAFPLPDQPPVERWRKLKYLIHEHYVVYAPSWKIWQHHRKLKTLTKWHRAAFFSYSLNNKLYLNNKELSAGAKNEFAAMMHFMRTDSFPGKSCTPEMLRKRAFRYKLLHFCLHGSSNRDSLNANTLYFGIDQREHALINALNGSDIAALTLKEKWAIISACETGIGQSNAEGTYSLARAFLQAGCEFTISSLWKIRTEASSEVLMLFYKHVQEGDLPWVALAKAKQDFIKNNNECQPHSWAALIPII